jgi:hypothetical protein
MLAPHQVVKRPASRKAVGRVAVAMKAAKPARPAKKRKADALAESEDPSSEEQSEDDEDADDDSDQEPELGHSGLFQAPAEVSASSAANFTASADHVKPGSALLCTHHTLDGFVDVKALYYVHNRFEHKEGLLVECSYVAASGKARQELQDMRLGSNTYLLLVRAERGSSELRTRDGIEVVTHWAAGPLDAFSEKWIHASERKLFAMKANLKASSAEAPATPQSRRKRKLDDAGSGEKAMKVAMKRHAALQDAEVSPFPPLPPPAVPPESEEACEDEHLPPALRRLKRKAQEGLDLDDSAVPQQPDDQDAVINQLKDKIKQMRSAEASPGKQRKVAEGASSSSGGKSTLMQKFLMEKLQRAKALHAGKADKQKKRRLEDADAAVALQAPEVSEDSSSGADASSASDPLLARKSGGQKASSSKKKKKKKKKKNRRKKKSTSSSGSSSSSDSGELFHDAGSSCNGLANRVELTAARKPGRLLKMTLEKMVKSLNPLAPRLKSSRPAVVYQYLQKALSPSVKLTPNQQRELSTLALALDFVLKGNLEGALEVLLQRFKSLESVSTGALSAKVAQNLEVIPRLEISSLSMSERNEATAMDRRWEKMNTASKGHSHSPSPGRELKPS